jgi:hypothetical protein
MKRVGHAIKQIKISGMEIFLIAVLLVFGVIMMVRPLRAGYDEDQHFNRVWQPAGQLYALTIRGVNSPAGKGRLLAYSMRPEYPLGTLLEDNFIFRYGCQYL